VFYAFDRHWAARLTCQNILNQAYVTGDSNAYAANASVPRTFIIELDYKF
jgi:outer membrane receptor protein involved in Fe transport